jgi:hypothetical protein
MRANMISLGQQPRRARQSRDHEASLDGHLQTLRPDSRHHSQEKPETQRTSVRRIRQREISPRSSGGDDWL